MLYDYIFDPLVFHYYSEKWVKYATSYLKLKRTGRVSNLFTLDTMLRGLLHPSEYKEILYQISQRPIVTYGEEKSMATVNHERQLNRISELKQKIKAKKVSQLKKEIATQKVDRAKAVLTVVSALTTTRSKSIDEATTSTSSKSMEETSNAKMKKMKRAVATINALKMKSTTKETKDGPKDEPKATNSNADNTIVEIAEE